MIRRTIAQLERMLGSRLVGAPGDMAGGADRLVEGVSTDTRTIVPGNLFVPLQAERDGHLYAQQAVDAGATAVLWRAGHEAPMPQGVPVLIVDNTLSAYQQLAREYRRELQVRVVGITGSNGKTTTKDLIGAVLATKYRVHKTEGNFNNHLGVPMTLLQMEEDAEVAVLEMGMSGRGEIALLSSIAEPDTAVITIIGESHLEQLGSREEIARAKTEILSGLHLDGFLVYNGESPLIEAVLGGMPKPDRFRSLRFGMGQGFDLYPTGLRMEANGTYFQVNDGAEAEFFIPLLGRHNVTNALAAIAVGREHGISDKLIAEGLASVQMTSMRIEVRTAPDGLTVLNDAYNASPTSMRAALQLLCELNGYSRKFAVLGDMLELGPQEAEFHRDIGAALGPHTADYVLTYGERARHIAESAVTRLPPEHVLSFDDKERLIEELRRLVRPSDVVLVKGSRGMQLEAVVSALVGDEESAH